MKATLFVLLFVGLTIVSCQEQCFQERLSQNPTLNSCFMETINNTADAFDAFCRMENCDELVAQTFEDCGRPGEAQRYRTTCLQDDMGRFCMSVIVNMELFIPAITACDMTDCSNANCRQAIDELGCCIAVPNLADFSSILPIKQCNVTPCNSARYISYSMVTITIAAILTTLYS